MRTMRLTLLLPFVLMVSIQTTLGKVVQGEVILSATTPFQYLNKFAFGLGDHEFSWHFDTGGVHGYHLVMYMDEVWDDAMSVEVCSEHLDKGARGHIVFPLVEGDSEDGWHKHALTHHVRPHFWYSALVNCNLSPHDIHGTTVQYTLEYYNNGSHFSEDEGMCMWTLLCFGSCIAILAFVTKHLQHATWQQLAPVVRVLLLALGLQCGGIVCQLLHDAAYASNGIGWSYVPMQLGAGLLHEGAKVVVTSLLLILAQGWTITSDTVPCWEVLAPLVGSTLAFEVVGQLAQAAYADSHDAFSSRAREGCIGFALVAAHLLLYCWFLSQTQQVLHGVRHMPAKQHFLRLHAISSSVWFLADPLLVVLGTACAAYYRQRLLVGGSLMLQTLALALLANLFLKRDSTYNRVSTASDSILPSHIHMPDSPTKRTTLYQAFGG